MSQAQISAVAARTREQRAWYLYDWANSAFATTVVTLFLGPYLTALAKTGADSHGMIRPLGITVDARSYWSYLVSLSVILQVVLMPVVGAIADASRRKRMCLAVAAGVGSLATMSMILLTGQRFLLGGALFLIANASFGASIVVYNSFLPEIATPEERDRVSSRGWGVGYLGGGVLLALNLLLYSNAEGLGWSGSLAVRVSLLSAGVWWAVFTIPSLLGLRDHRGTGVHKVQIVAQLTQSLRELQSLPVTATFLLAFLLYNDAIQAVLALSAQFGSDELHMPTGQLTLAILMVQFVAFAGAIAFQWLAALISAQRALVASLVLWTAVLFYIYASVRSAKGFFIAAAVVAAVMGGSQSLSRSLFAQMIPKGKEAEYFSLYEISDKGTSWVSPLVFGLALQYTGSYRLSILSLAVFFVLGLLILLRVDVARGTAAVREVPVQRS